jgi:diazepam-binding inhibitor (GABA receptor modulator, acyl-CoA-binding protein)
MSDLKTKFEAAAVASKKLPERPDNATLLKMYALFKQGSEGDVAGERPGMADFVARAKFDAWAKLQGTTKDAAMQQYIDLVEELQEG